jgi:hypothetical protein
MLCYAMLSCCSLQGIGCLVTHEEELSDYLSMSVLLSQPPRSPSHAAARDSYLATLDFVEALCETSSSLTRFPPVSDASVNSRMWARTGLTAAVWGGVIANP